MAAEPNKPQARELIVIGMHRSGTSLVTRLLNLAGAYFGPEHQHIGQNEENPKGFWERTDVRHLNDLLLYAADADWDRPLNYKDWQPPATVKTTFDEGALKIMAEFEGHAHPILKEPRICLTLASWRAHWIKPIFVWVHRHPLEIALSLKKRNGFPLNYGLALWEWYVLKAWQYLQREVILSVHHPQFLANPTEALQVALTKLRQMGCGELSMPPQSDIDAFVEKKLHRAKFQPEDESRFLSPNQRSLWQQMSDPNWVPSSPPPAPSSQCHELLQLGDATAQTFLRRIRQNELQLQRLEKDRQKSELLKAYNRQLRREISDLTKMANRMMKRLRELEQGWTHLRQSKLWKLGLAANKLRSLITPTKTKSRTENSARASPSKKLLDPAVTVIVPIFNALTEVRQCLESLAANTRHPHRLLLINDASTQPELAPWLEQFQARFEHVHLISHEENAGYTASINEGIQWAEADDVVLLNSDTIVPSHWLTRLQQCAYGQHNIATVTPLSNAAGAFSVPYNQQVNELPAGYDVERFALLVQQTAPGLAPKVPTGNGFCMFIRREVLHAIGPFDQEAFPRGYGEENDFCMRASKAGFFHLIDDTSFVFHHRSASFGAEKQALVTHARGVLTSRWPDYKPAVTQWLGQDPLDPFRELLQARLQEDAPLIQQQPRPNPILYILHDGGGGTRLTAGNLMIAMDQRFPAWMLITGRDHWELFKKDGTELTSIGTWAFEKTWHFDESLGPEKRAILRRICSHLGIRIAHVRHLLGNAPEVLQCLKSQGIRVIYSFHDFYAICPTIHLIDRTGRFCGGDCHAHDDKPAESGFHRPGFEEDCALAGNWFQDAPLIRHHYVESWKKRMYDGLQHIDAAVTTSHSAQTIILRHYPLLAKKPFALIEHGRDFQHREALVKAPAAGPMDLVCFGALNRTKGLDMIESLAILDKQHQHFRFHLLGQVSSEWEPPSAAVVLHGAYANDQLMARLQAIEPSVALIPSLCSETYCHTLSEAWNAGLPVICSDLGALRERVHKHGGGWLAHPYQPQDWYDLLLRIKQDPDQYREKATVAKRYRQKTVETMAGEYMALYQEILQPLESEASPT